MSKLDILVVDDELALLDLIQSHLEHADYQVETRGNGADAIALIEERYFDVVISDFFMPGNLDGVDVLEATKSKWPQSEFILITGNPSVDNAVEVMKKGALDYLQKPIDFEELQLKLQHIEYMKWLVEDSKNIHEAINVSEQNAAQTIRNLERLYLNIRTVCTKTSEFLANEKLDPYDRIEKAKESLKAIL